MRSQCAIQVVRFTVHGSRFTVRDLSYLFILWKYHPPQKPVTPDSLFCEISMSSLIFRTHRRLRIGIKIPFRPLPDRISIFPWTNGKPISGHPVPNWSHQKKRFGLFHLFWVDFYYFEAYIWKVFIGYRLVTVIGTYFPSEDSACGTHHDNQRIIPIPETPRDYDLQICRWGGDSCHSDWPCMAIR